MNRTITSTNPGDNYSLLGEVHVSSDDEIVFAVQKAHAVKLAWKEMGIEKRVEILKGIQEMFAASQGELAQLISREVGKSMRDAQFRVKGFLEEFNWFLAHAEKALQPEITHEDASSIHSIVYEPHGVAAVILPWNHPFGMFVWGVIPNLLAGNTVVFKHSEECPLCGKFIDAILKQSGLPEGVCTQVYGDGETGQFLLEQDINLIWFTGSSATGKKVYELAGKKFVKAILEMGGSNPCIVFEDVDIDQVADKCCKKRLSNCGQACDALKRLIVHSSIFDKIIEALKNRMQAMVLGPTSDFRSDIGCLAAKRQLETLQSQVHDALQKGATLVTGGKQTLGLRGAYYEPTILINIQKDMRVWREEVFGPVLVIVPFETEGEALELAHDTEYGLGAIVCTRDKERALRIASRLKAGTVEINMANHWLPCNPFGGYKSSGMGREHGILGMRELCQVKVISREKI
jgi:succinate-semialdehyde dehydrogenase/glutarate-semialdehyde dehydrogenase